VASLRNGGAPFRQITPTDVAQFIRLEQCERYLRLRLQTRAQGDRFLRDQGIQPEPIPPLLTRSGGQFEQRIEADARRRLPLLNLATDLSKNQRASSDNALVAEKARALEPGAEILLLQPRLEAMVGEWRLRGDIDLLLLRRDEDGALHALIADMKSSTSAKMEHRLQVAFYHQMLDAVMTEAGAPLASITLGILYRGAADDRVDLTVEERSARQEQRELAQRYFGARSGLLELIADPAQYLQVAEDLVTGPTSTAARVADASLEDATFHLTYKCDGCLFNQFCMKWSAEHDDLSLLPHLTAQEKTALRRTGVTSMSSLAALKDLAPVTKGTRPELVPAPGREELVRRLSATWPVGPRLDELIHRARRYRKWKRDPTEALSYIPHRGQGSLPFSSPDHNPNLVRVYIDAQHDYLEDRIYLLGALVVGCEAGEPRPERRRSIVHLADGPPDAAREEGLFVAWTRDLIQAIHDLAAPDAEGRPRAPIHLIFFNHFEQRQLLAGLSRHFTRVTRAAPLYDRRVRLADRHLPGPGDPRAEELPHGVPVAADRGCLPGVYLGYKRFIPEDLPCSPL